MELQRTILMVVLMIPPHSPKSPFRLMLAPMEGITDDAFRALCHSHGADLTFTPMARVSGLCKKNKVTWNRIAILSDTPTEIQLLCNSTGRLERFLGMFDAPAKGFRGFNLNLGCPSPQIIRDGLGSAMIKRVKRTQELVKIFQDRGYSVSIKLRLGLNKYEKEKKAYLNLIEGVDAEYFIVHARHAGETLSDPADFSVYGACVETGKGIIANGDIRTQEQIDQVREQGVVGVMIGRAAVEVTTIFTKGRERGRGVHKGCNA